MGPESGSRLGEAPFTVKQRGVKRASGLRGVLEMHLGRVAATIFVALDGAGEPPFDVAGRGQQRLAELGRRAPKRDPLEALAVIAAGQPADVVLADDRGLDQPRGAGGDPRRGPAGAVGPGGVKRVTQG